MIWIIINQLARRNITPTQRKDLMGIQYKLEKKLVGEHGPECSQNEHIHRTVERIAKQHNVSPSTVQRAEKFHDGLEKLPPEEKAAVLAEKSLEPVG